MSALLQATQTHGGLTENGAVTHTSSGSYCLDLFFTIGASRGKDITSQFLLAKGENPELATRILLWARDVRSGAGERQTFRDLVLHIATDANINALIAKTAELGRFDDLEVFLKTPFETPAVKYVADALRAGNGLAAKWVPRKGRMFNALRAQFEYTPKQLRKMLVELSNTVEQLMCAKRFDQIEFDKIPSLAGARLVNAFKRNAPAEYSAFQQKLLTGEAKINAGAVYPYDVIKTVKQSTDKITAEVMWKNLPDYMADFDGRILPIIDVSSSMQQPVGGKNKSLQAIDVAVSLGLYVAERNKSIFKDQFITFHEQPSFVQLKGSLYDKVNATYRAQWGGSTNLQAVFDMVLNAAVRSSLPETEMPTHLLIISDMEFNAAHVRNSKTNYEVIRAKYEAAGYKQPTIIFWRVDARADNVPVRVNDEGAILFSGFSPSLLRTVLTADPVVHEQPVIDPYEQMMKVISSERYAL